ncbi:MAG: phosphoribosylanthranilate isomerase [Deltaproteobacteria bacterium]|nr:phosphoribosylanthranilate isomerase [Deltaproteobacteria bacterium]
MSDARVKVCGLRRVADAEACVRAGVAFAGLNRVPGSRRAVDLATCAALMTALGPVQPVLVYRDAPRAQVLGDLETLAGIGLCEPWLQLHGDETPQLAATLRKNGLRVVRALAGDSDGATVAKWLDIADAVLLDGRQPGSGSDWAWRLPAGCDRQRLWLAGGLAPHNVARALQLAPAAVVDAASGLERDGALDAAKISEFCQQVRREAAMVRSV